LGERLVSFGACGEAQTAIGVESFAAVVLDVELPGSGASFSCCS
jgi:hypothetical protein